MSLLPVDIRLPAWGDCALKVNNYAWREKEGHTHLVEDCPSALERFIFEYEDADPLKEKQFREMLLAVVVELTQPLTAREIDLSERTSQRDAWRERAFKAETSLTARDDALASIRVFAQDCIERGYFDKGALGNLYSIRDLCDSKGEEK